MKYFLLIGIVLIISCQPKPYYVFRYETFLQPVKSTQSNVPIDTSGRVITAPNTLGWNYTNELPITTSRTEIAIAQSSSELKIPGKISRYISSFEGIKAPVNEEKKKITSDQAAKLSLWGNFISNLLLLLAVGPNYAGLAVAGFFLYLGSMWVALRGTKSERKRLRNTSYTFNMLLSLPWIMISLLLIGWSASGLLPLISVLGAMALLTIFQVKS